MSEEGEWKQQCNPKKRYNQKKKEKDLMWKSLSIEYPHIVTPQHAKKLQCALKVDYLEQHFLSDEWISLQKEGWAYVKTFKGSSDSYTLGEHERLLPIVNRYGDYALFRKLDPLWMPRTGTLSQIDL